MYSCKNSSLEAKQRFDTSSNYSGWHKDNMQRIYAISEQESQVRLFVPVPCIEDTRTVVGSNTVTSSNTTLPTHNLGDCCWNGALIVVVVLVVPARVQLEKTR